MRMSRFTEAQTTGMIKEQEAGGPQPGDVLRVQDQVWRYPRRPS